MEKLNELKQELLIMKISNIKPNYSELPEYINVIEELLKSRMMVMKVNQLIEIKNQD